jgi:prolyl-tRNA editing enzyme YbaK/EbsC (Cys-tRNA(Pro) deacylase)
MQFGTLTFEPVTEHSELVAQPTQAMIEQLSLSDVLVSEIDPGLADTAAFCEQYKIGLDVSANCVVVEARRGETKWYAACMILATDKIDVNSIVRRHLEAKKISFAPMDTAVSLTKMEYGGITPIGLPADWPILVDAKVAETERAIIGSGIRSSKLLVLGTLFASLPNATVMNIAKIEEGAE